MKNSNKIRTCLDTTFERLKEVYHRTSVLNALRIYVPKSIVDLELWGFLCATLDFQAPVMTWLNPMLKGLVEGIERQGLKFIDLVYNESLAKELLSSFPWAKKHRGLKHRFLNIRDILLLLHIFRSLLRDYNSLGTLVKGLYGKALSAGIKEPMSYIVKCLARTLREYMPKNYKKKGLLVPDPSGNSAFKRFNLFFRWMVRPYPDLGVWKFIDKKHLLVSLDTGVLRTVSRVFNVEFKGGATWDNVLKVTEIFRKIDPEDPAKYDYVFSRPAIMKYCMKNTAKNRCYLCPLNEICASAKVPPTFKTEAKMSKKEEEILNDYLALNRNKYDYVGKEIPLGDRRIDAILHGKQCKWYVVEVEQELNYTAIGQAVVYRRTFKNIYKKTPETIILCRKAQSELKTICEIDANIKVIVVRMFK